VPDFLGLPLPLFFQNNLKAQTYGTELSTTYQVLDWWRLHGSYDLLKENFQIKPGTQDFNKTLNETADPQQQLSLRSAMNLPARVELDAEEHPIPLPWYWIAPYPWEQKNTRWRDAIPFMHDYILCRHKQLSSARTDPIGRIIQACDCGDGHS